MRDVETEDDVARALAELPARPDVTVTPLPMARRLAAAGLEWTPRDGDRFVVPDRGMDDHVFLVASMVVEVRVVGDIRLIAFNGTTEWALDQVLTSEVVWLPREADLRHALDDRFQGLWRHAGRWIVECRVDGRTRTIEGDTAIGALAEATLSVLADG